MPPRIARLLPPLVLLALLLAGAWRLVRDPGGLLVDADRPAIDRAWRGPPRGPGNDLTDLLLPHHHRIAEALARLGRVPAWDPAGFGGRPLVGNPQAGIAYPPAWLAWVVRSPATLGWITLAHLFLGGLGAYALARRSGLSRPAATIAAGCFELSPYVAAQVFAGHYPHVWAACWTPWAFRAALEARQGRRRGFLALPPILALALLTGHPQEGFYLAAAIGLVALADAARLVPSAGARPALRRALAWTATLSLAAGLVAAEVVPVLLAQRGAVHGEGLTPAEASRYHVHPLNLVQLLSPYALGGPADYRGPDNHAETLLAFGWVPLVLAVLAVTRSPRRSLARTWGLLAVVGVLLAGGRKLGLLAIAHATLPGFDRFRVPSRSLFLASLAVAMLAGLGAEAVGRSSLDFATTDRRYRRVVAVIVLGLLALIPFGRLTEAPPPPILAISPRRPADLDRDVPPITALVAGRIAREPTFWLAMAVPALAFARLRRRPGDAGRVALLLGAVALAEPTLHAARLWQVAPAGRFLVDDPIAGAIDRLRDPDAGPVRIRALDTFYPDRLAIRAGIDKTNLGDYFQLARAADLYETLYPIFEHRRPGSDSPSRRAIRQGVLDRMAVAFLVAGPRDPAAPWPVAARGLLHGKPFTLYRNPGALPRAYVVPRARPCPDGPSAVALFPHNDPRSHVLMPSDPLAPSAPRQRFTPARYDAHDPDRLVIRVTTAAAGLLVIADTWAPGWSATVDGRPAPVLLGNLAQRVVPLPRPGRHVIVLRYQPPGVILGLALSALSGAVWLAAVACRVRKGIPADRMA